MLACMETIACRVLEENMVVTVEPGCYFNPFLLRPAMQDPAQAHFFNQKRVEASMVSLKPKQEAQIGCYYHPRLLHPVTQYCDQAQCFNQASS